MSAYTPPTYNVTPFNPAYFATDTSGITESQANALYLRKTTADTASALETFTAGIATNSIATTSLASALTIGSSSNTGTITIATTNTGNSNASPAISIGTDSGTKTIKINNNTNSVHCSSIDLAGSTINNITGNTGNLSIGSLQTTGTIDIGGLSTRTGAIYIGNGGTTNVLPITIGSTSATSSTTINNPIMNLNYTTIPSYTSSQIGYRVIKLNNVTATTSATANAVTQFQLFSMPPGVWMFECNLTVGTASTFAWYISPTTAVVDNSRACGGVYTTASVRSRMSGIIDNSTTANWYLNGSASVVSVGITAIYLHITRIA